MLYNKFENYLSLSIYQNIYFIYVKFQGFFSTENNFNIIYEREWLLITLVRRTTNWWIHERLGTKLSGRFSQTEYLQKA